MRDSSVARRTPRVVSGSRRVAGARQGLSVARIEMELERQNNRCIVCTRELGAHFAVDHDHSLAKRDGHDEKKGCEKCFRGIVCNRCNAVLGWGWDDPEFFDRCAAYIRLARSGELRHG